MWAVNILPWRARAKAKVRWQVRCELAIVIGLVVGIVLVVALLLGQMQARRQIKLETLQAQLESKANMVSAQTQKREQHALVNRLPNLQNMQTEEFAGLVHCLNALEVAKGKQLALHTIRYQWPVIRILGSATAELRVFDFIERLQYQLPALEIKVEQLKSTGRKTQRDLFEFSMEIKLNHSSWLKSLNTLPSSLKDSNVAIEILE